MYHERLRVDFPVEERKEGPDEGVRRVHSSARPAPCGRDLSFVPSLSPKQENDDQNESIIFILVIVVPSFRSTSSLLLSNLQRPHHSHSSNEERSKLVDLQRTQIRQLRAIKVNQKKSSQLLELFVEREARREKRDDDEPADTLRSAQSLPHRSEA